MQPKIDMNNELFAYFNQVGFREEPILAELRQETYGSIQFPGMQISPEQGPLLSMLVKLMGAKRTLEVGVFTGYSSLSVAMALPDDGEIIACDVNEETTAVAKRYWQKAGVDHKVSLRIGSAVDTLQGLIDAGEGGQFDLAFLDADKDNYDTYYEQSLQLLRSGGLIIIDNVLWHNAVIDSARQDADTVAIRAINEKVHADERVDMLLVPIGDGMTLARKK